MDHATSEQLRFLTSPRGNGGPVVISIGVPTGGASAPPEITCTAITTDSTSTSTITCNEDTNSGRRKQQR